MTLPMLTVDSIPATLAAVGALGTAATGLVDATKVWSGGISNVGFPFIKAVVKPYEDALKLVNTTDPYATLRGNWLNGMSKADQKAVVKSIIRLGITPETAAALAKGAPGVDAAGFVAVATKLGTPAALTPEDLEILGRFDAIVDAQMDAGFERADQKYRNASKVAAAFFAVLLSVVGAWLMQGTAISKGDWLTALFLGLVATPLAPVVKDLTSALGTAVSAFKLVKG